MSRASDISDAAAQWLVRLEAQTSAQLWDAFQVWLDSDPRHRAAFVRLRVAWNRADRLKQMRPVDGTIDSQLLAREHLNPAAVARDGLHAVQGTSRSLIRISSRFHWRHRLVAAAVIAAAAVIGWLAVARVGWTSYQTDVGGRQAVVLPDGSSVQLNTDTLLRAKLSVARRDISLARGEALFHVAPDAARPFYVTAGGTIVRAVGTEFSVRIRDVDHVDVLVTEGRVAIGTQGTKSSLQPSTLPESAARISAQEAASVTHSTINVKALPDIDLTRRLAWTAGHLDFQGETLAEAVQEFNRYNQRQLIIIDPAIRRVSVGGIFRTTDLDSFVAALQHLFGIRARFVPNSREIQLIGDEGLPQ